MSRMGRNPFDKASATKAKIKKERVLTPSPLASIDPKKAKKNRDTIRMTRTPMGRLSHWAMVDLPAQSAVLGLKVTFFTVGVVAGKSSK